MICTNCGRQIKDGTRFCAYCGAAQAQSPAAWQMQQPAGDNAAQQPNMYYAQQPSPAPAARPRKKSKLPLVLAALAAAVLLCVGLCGYSFTEIGKIGDVLDLQKQMHDGEKYLKELDYQSAVLAYTRAIELDQNNSQAYAGLFAAYMALGQMEEADNVLQEMRENGIEPDETMKQAQQTAQTTENTGGDTQKENDMQRMVLASKKEAVYDGMIGEDGRETNYLYDNKGRVVIEQKNGFWGSVVQYTYDADDRVIQKDTYDRYGVILGRSTKCSYNDHGDLVLEDDGDGYPTTYSYEYDDEGRPTKIEAGGVTRRYSYDENGNCVQELLGDDENNKTLYSYVDGVKNVWPEQNEIVYFRPMADREEKVNQWENDITERTFDEDRKILTERSSTRHFDSQDGTELYSAVDEYDFTYNEDGTLQKVAYSSDQWNEESTMELCSETLYEYAPLSILLAEGDYKAANVDTAQPFDLGSGVQEPEIFVAEDKRQYYYLAAGSEGVMRLAPNENAPQVQTIPGGSTTIEGIGFSNTVKDWILTEWNGQYGWVSGKESGLMWGE